MPTRVKKRRTTEINKHGWIELSECCKRFGELFEPNVHVSIDVFRKGRSLSVSLTMAHACGLSDYEVNVYIHRSDKGGLKQGWVTTIRGSYKCAERVEWDTLDWSWGTGMIKKLPVNLIGYTVTVIAVVSSCCRTHKIIKETKAFF